MHVSFLYFVLLKINSKETFALKRFHVGLSNHTLLQMKLESCIDIKENNIFLKMCKLFLVARLFPLPWKTELLASTGLVCERRNFTSLLGPLQHKSDENGSFVELPRTLEFAGALPV